MIHYRKTQVSWPAIVPLAATMLILGAVFAWQYLTAPLVMIAALMLAILLLFATMTVIVDDTAVQARFGIGLVRKRVPLDQIQSWSVVRNPWYYGWGIHFIPGGMMYNASGLSAVELRLTNGRVVRIGSGEPEALAAAVRRVATPLADRTEPSGDWSVALVVLGIIVAVFAIVVATIYSGMQPPVVSVTPNAFSVRNGLYSNTVPLRRMTSLSLDEAIPRVRGRTNGVAAGETLRGSFRVETWGSARLYVNVNHPPFVVIHTDDGVLAVNFADRQQTRELYAQLRQAVDRSR